MAKRNAAQKFPERYRLNADSNILYLLIGLLSSMKRAMPLPQKDERSRGLS